MIRLELRSPLARRHIGQRIPPAPRLSDLAGKTIGVYWNQKPGGDVALERLASHLRERFSNIEFRNFTGSVGGVRPAASEEDIERIVSVCDGVIGATAD